MSYEIDGFSKKDPRYYVKVRDGQWTIGKDDNATKFDRFTGKLVKIDYSEKEVEFEGKKFRAKNWDVFFRTEKGVEIIWSVPHINFMFQNFINAMAGLTDFTIPVQLSTYMKKGKSNIWIMQNDKKCDWKFSIEQLPKIDTVKVNGKDFLDKDGNKVYNYEPRLEWTRKVVEELNAKLNALHPVVNYDTGEVDDAYEPALDHDIPF